MPRPAIRALLLASLLASGAACAADPAPVPGRYSEVTVEPADTSAYVARVSLSMPPFVRHGAAYTSNYTAKVFPFFFFNERGTLVIDITDDQIRQLGRGETVSFEGKATNSGGASRRIEGRAVPDPAGAGHGKIKVKVRVTRSIELVFNTTYRFTGKE